GKIAGLLDSAAVVKTPLQKRLARVSRNLAVAAIAICIVVFVAGVMQGEGMLRMFLTAVSLAVAAVPEALPAVVTISLALGARRMVKHQALIRRLPAVETLGSVTSICTDKTGTLTENRMRVEQLQDRELKAVTDRNDAPELLLALAISNEVRRDGEGRLLGDPTEIALYEKAATLGVSKEEVVAAYPLEAMIPFSSERQMMTTLHRTPEGGWLSITKGGMEAVAACCAEMDRQGVEEEHQRMAMAGLRVLAFACRRYGEKPGAVDRQSLESGLTFLGLSGAMDPPRPEAAEAVATCKAAGIRPVMITGDHPVTARAIAQRLGIIDNDGDEVITGRELAEADPKQFAEKAARARVYARVAPEQKLTIITALQTRGEAVAMTGDGVNDAPALKQADIGVAMGINGTDVAKEAADMVLLDDNFATIVRAVREGRTIYDNIRKFIKYTLTSNTGEIWTIFLAPFLGMPIPLLPIHILWINLATDGAPGLALTVEPGEPDIMARPPRPLTESLFAHRLWLHILWVGLLMGGVCLWVQGWGIRHHAHWQTMVFTALCLSQFGHALAIRSERQSLFTMGIASNPFLLVTVLVSIAAQIGIIYHPFLQRVFHTQPLTMAELAVTGAASTMVFWGVEAEKWWKRRTQAPNLLPR
ncbi:MAG: cation-translocating P-type ATPase, partial [Desulfobulbaceae bacterium]|nr:cation-translocating P-type ATPase [Desulfobulbaceae bacterium]